MSSPDDRERTRRAAIPELALRALAIAFAGDVVLSSCGGSRTPNQPTQHDLDHNAWSEPAEVYGSDLQLTDDHKQISIPINRRGQYDLVVRTYSIDGRPDTEVCEMVEEHFTPEQQSLDGHVWTRNVLADAIAGDASLAQPNGDRLHMVGYVLTTYAPGENITNSQGPSGHRVFMVESATVVKRDS